MPKVKIKKHTIVPIVGDGAIAAPSIAWARLIPVLIVDCNNHKPLEDLILVHKDTPPGDVLVSWGWESWGWERFRKRQAFLTLNFQRPVETSATFCFDVSLQGGIVDWIINVRGLYLQPLSSGAKVSEGIAKPKILIEVPPTATFPSWDKIYRRSVEKKYQRQGLSKKQAVEATVEHFARLRELQLRTPNKSKIDNSET